MIVDKEKRPLIFVTNDDGIFANGLKQLIKIAQEIGDVVVVAPETAHSGMSHAITVRTPLHLREVKVDKNIRIYACTGTPADCVKIGFCETVDRLPDFLFSGINHGANTSTSIMYSGTMAAAIEGCLNGVKSIGFSIDEFNHDVNLTLAAKYARKIINNVKEYGLEPNVCLNVNFPAVKKNNYEGIKICHQANGFWKEAFDKRKNPHNIDYYWLSGTFKNNEPHNHETDEWAIANNYVSVVPIKTDMTDYKSIDKMKEWNFKND